MLTYLYAVASESVQTKFTFCTIYYVVDFILFLPIDLHSITLNDKVETAFVFRDFWTFIKSLYVRGIREKGVA